MQLSSKYDGLRQMQNELAENCEAFRSKLDNQLKISIEQKRENLILRQKSLAKANEHLQENLRIWKKDIEQKQVSLSQHKEATNRTAKQRLNELNETLASWDKVEIQLANERTRLNVKKKAWQNTIAEKKKLLSATQSEYDKIWKEWNKQSQAYQTATQKLTTSLEADLLHEQSLLDKMLNEVKQECEQSLNAQEENHLRQLRTEIANELPEVHSELKQYLKDGDFSSLSMKKYVTSSDSEKLKQYLTRSLTKIGIDVEPFIQRANA
jgi:chromosome segregation ATPase